MTENEVAKVEDLVRKVVVPEDLGMIVSNIGTTPDFSAIYSTNSAMHTGFVQVSLKEDHKTGSYEYMARDEGALAKELPELSAYFQSGGLVDAVLNMGLPAPIDVQVAGSNMERRTDSAVQLAGRSGDPRRRRRISFRRTSITPRSNSISTACAPRSSGSIRRKSSIT